MKVGKIEDWVDMRVGLNYTRVGFETCNFHGTDYVTCHEGNERGDYTGPIHHLELEDYEG